MNKKISILLSLSCIALFSTLTGCKSPGANAAGVMGEGYEGGEFGMGGSEFDTIIGEDGEFGMGGMGAGANGMALGNMFVNGTEHPGMFPAILFAYDSSQVSASERGTVEAVANHLMANSNMGVIIEGHCDEKGSLEYNMSLGERRALAVRSYLTGLGIAPERIQTKSMGEEMPAVHGHDEASRRQNRRGEFVLYY